MADNPDTARLIFPPGYKLDGFESNLTSGQAGEADPVVRELLQNCLDAALRDGKRDQAVVHFTIADHPIHGLPGLDDYRAAFIAGRRERESRDGGITTDEHAAIDRIAALLESDVVPVLFCRDNGIGLDRSRLQSLLSEGNSSRSTGGAGSKGVGHLTAYAASDLRYVLYAGKRPEGEIATGHAVLAAHKIGGQRRDPDGYWQLEADLTNFSIENGLYPDHAPSLLETELDQVSDRGSVVAIAGFNDFDNDDRHGAVEDIARVAAVNFMAAIWERRMVVNVFDESNGTTVSILRDSLEDLLRPARDQQRAKVGGWLAGGQAYRAFQTLKHGDELTGLPDESVRVFFRRPDAATNESSRVQIFRDGMWITNDALRLRPGDFRSFKPFEAVVLLQDTDPDDRDEFYNLVRDAEGPEHRVLKKMRKMPAARQSLLRDKLEELANRLREEAGEVESQESYTPAGFAVFNADDVRDATPFPRIRYRPTGGYQTGTDPTNQVAEDPPTPEEPGPGIPSERHTRRAPAPGRAVRLKRSVVPLESENGEVRRLIAAVEIGEEAAKRDRYELRVFAESGSDESCEQPLQPQWLSIRSVTVDGQEINAGGKLEVAIPKTARSLIINLNDAVPATATLELDIVRRRTAAGSGE